MKILFEVVTEKKLTLQSRYEAVKEDGAAMFDLQAVEIPDGLGAELVNLRKAEARTLLRFAVWAREREPELFEQLELEMYLPEKDRQSV